MNLEAYLKDVILNKKVLILGFGREGRSTYKFLKKIGGYSSLAVADLNPVEDINEVVHFGCDYQKAIPEYDLVFKSPGVVLDRPEYGQKIISQTDVIIDCFKQSMIGITGTKGKSTTTSLIYHVLEYANKKPVLMGNIGIPAFDAAEKLGEDSIIVYELSCHQLEYAKQSPHRGVLLNIFPEHLDHYGSFERYKAAKENIYKNMTENDFLVCGYDFLPKDLKCSCVSVSMNKDDNADYTAYDEDVFDKAKGAYYKPDCSLFGIHNMHNIAVAFAVCNDCGVKCDEFFEALHTYKPLAHRLELFATIDDVQYFDDSISTIPETAIKAMSSIKNVGTIILGGMDRGIELDSLCDYLIKNPIENVILMPDTGKTIFEKLSGKYKYNLYETNGLAEAASLAKKVTKPGTACVLSPAAASYGFFKNFEERGDCFKKEICSDKT